MEKRSHGKKVKHNGEHQHQVGGRDYAPSSPGTPTANRKIPTLPEIRSQLRVLDSEQDAHGAILSELAICLDDAERALLGGVTPKEEPEMGGAGSSPKSDGLLCDISDDIVTRSNVQRYQTVRAERLAFRFRQLLSAAGIEQSTGVGKQVSAKG